MPAALTQPAADSGGVAAVEVVAIDPSARISLCRTLVISYAGQDR